MKGSCSTCRKRWRCLESDQMIQTLEAELRQKDKHLRLMAEVAVVMSAVAAVATGAMVAIAQAAGMF